MTMTSNTGRGFSVQERDEFLTSGAIIAKIATTMEDGWPVISPVWYDWLADECAFLIVSKERTSLVRNLRRDPRCAVLIDNPGPPYKRVSVQGRVQFLPNDFDWITPARAQARRYLGPDGVPYAEATFGFPRVPFKVRAVKITTWNGGGFDRTFHRDTLWRQVDG